MMSELNFAESRKISHCFAFQGEGRDWLALAQMSLFARVHTLRKAVGRNYAVTHLALY